MVLRILVFYGMTWFFLIFFGGIQQATGVLQPQIGLAKLAPGTEVLMMQVLDVMFAVPYWVINGIVWAVVALVVVLAKRELFLGLKSPKEGG